MQDMEYKSLSENLVSIRTASYSTNGFRINSKMSPICICKSSSGMSLIAVLWIVAILTVLAAEFIYSMHIEIQMSKNWSDQMSAFYAAKAGFGASIAVLKDDETDYDSLDEDWTEEITGQLSNSSDIPSFTTVIVDESSKINVNTADEETLTKAILYCMGSSNENELVDDQMTAEAQALAAAVIEKRPYRTAAGMAKATDMTPEILYGESAVAQEGEEAEEGTTIALVDITTVYSVDKNTTPDGTNRVNINSADANQIQQGINPEGQEVITQQEAQAIVDYRDELGGNAQGGAQGGVTGGGQNQQQPAGGQNQQQAAGGQNQQQAAGGQNQQQGYSGIGQLLDAPAISQNTFDSISSRITVEEGGENQQDRININTADANELQNLDGIDQGIADSIVRYREQNPFDNIEEIREVKLISIDDMRVIVDRVTTSDGETAQGKVNINTAPLEILAMLTGLDEEKAQAIVDRRTVPEGQEATIVTPEQGSQESGPFTGLGQLLDVEGIDEQTFRNLIDHVSYRSYAYRIESEGKSEDGKIIQSCTAVVDRSGQRVVIKYWKQE